MVESQKSLEGLQTFGLSAKAFYFAIAEKVDTLRTLISHPMQPKMVLGGGSNVLFTKDYEGLLILNRIKGIEILREYAYKVHLRIGGGENWHDLVRWAIDHGYGGIENMSLIPGTVGAAPIQNIGAYGVELKDVFVSCEAIDLSNGKLRVFTNKACRFGYRDSTFKQENKGKYCITSVTLSLTKHKHKVNTSYGDIAKQLEAMHVQGAPTIREVSDAVIAIRQSKLPDPAKIGNCGSFFKNPEISSEAFAALKDTHPLLPGYPTTPGWVKVPAGWLIEQCGWKGKRVGNTGCYERQALVIVNYGGATGAEVQSLVRDIIQSVKERFGIQLEPEVQMV